MFINAFALTLGAGLALATLQPASADTYRSDIGRDIREVRSDRAAIQADEARLAHERSELAKARAREREDIRRGNLGAAIRDDRVARHEASEVRAAQNKLAADRAKLNHDTRDLRHDVAQHHHRYWHW